MKYSIDNLNVFKHGKHILTLNSVWEDAKISLADYMIIGIKPGSVYIYNIKKRTSDVRGISVTGYTTTKHCIIFTIAENLYYNYFIKKQVGYYGTIVNTSKNGNIITTHADKFKFIYYNNILMGVSKLRDNLNNVMIDQPCCKCSATVNLVIVLPDCKLYCTEHSKKRYAKKKFLTKIPLKEEQLPAIIACT